MHCIFATIRDGFVYPFFTPIIFPMAEGNGKPLVSPKHKIGILCSGVVLIENAVVSSSSSQKPGVS